MNQSNKERLILLMSGTIAISLVALVVKPLIPSPTPSPTITTTPVAKEVLDQDKLTIGLVSSRQQRGRVELDYNLFEDYLKSTFGDRVAIQIQGDQDQYEYAKDQIAKKNWDLVFTLSPMLSIAARNNGYYFAAKMFPQSKTPYYTGAIFVRRDSNIQSIDQLNAQTTIALGGANSPHSFYLPVYDLYGKSVKIIKDLNNDEIINKVETGQVDAGAGVYIALKDNPRFKIIYQSRSIPGSGVYLSPNLTPKDRETIKRVMLTAPINIQNKANYGASQEVNYQNFLEIVHRTEEVLQCADFRNNPVDLFCRSDPPNSPLPLKLSPKINGRVNGNRNVTSEAIQLTLSGSDGQTYQVFVNPQVLKLVPSMPDITNIHGTNLQIIGVDPVKVGGTLELKVVHSSQIVVMK